MNPSDQLAIEQGCYQDEKAAENVRDFFHEFLRHSSGRTAGKPFDLLEWQWEKVILPLFSWKRKDGLRRYRRAYIEVPKKNGKTTLCAGLCLYFLLADAEPGPLVFSAAADKEQAGLIYSECEAMVGASSALREYCECIAHKKLIRLKEGRGHYQALSADVPTKEGLNISALVFDELHVQPDRTMWDTLAYGSGFRDQPMHISISTAGVYEPESIGWEQHTYAEQILSGEITDPSFFALIYAADPEDDWTDPAVWRKANPSLGHTIREDNIEQFCREAQNSPRKQNSFLRYNLNIWTQQEDRWIDIATWDGCKSEDLPPLSARDGCECWVGLDLSSTRDLTAMAIVFRSTDPTASYDVYPFFWLPANAAITTDTVNRQIYANWVRQGDLEQTSGDVIDYPYLRTRIRDILEPFYVQAICYDPREATQIAQQLQDEDGFNLLKVPQGYGHMNSPSKAFESLIAKHKLRHGGHPILNWCVSNVSVKYDSTKQLIMPEKPKEHGAPKKIDGVVAVILALSEATRATQLSDELVVPI